MSSFSARLRLPGYSRILLGVLVDVTDETISVTSAGREIARWGLDEIDISNLPDGFHIKGSKAEVVLGVTEPTRFASALGLGSDPTPSAPATDNRRRANPASQRTNDWFDDLRRMAGPIPASS